MLLGCLVLAAIVSVQALGNSTETRLGMACSPTGGTAGLDLALGGGSECSHDLDLTPGGAVTVGAPGAGD